MPTHLRFAGLGKVCFCIFCPPPRFLGPPETLLSSRWQASAPDKRRNGVEKCAGFSSTPMGIPTPMNMWVWLPACARARACVCVCVRECECVCARVCVCMSCATEATKAPRRWRVTAKVAAPYGASFRRLAAQACGASRRKRAAPYAQGGSGAARPKPPWAQGRRASAQGGGALRARGERRGKTEAAVCAKVARFGAR